MLKKPKWQIVLECLHKGMAVKVFNNTELHMDEDGNLFSYGGKRNRVTKQWDDVKLYHHDLEWRCLVASCNSLPDEYIVKLLMDLTLTKYKQGK